MIAELQQELHELAQRVQALEHTFFPAKLPLSSPELVVLRDRVHEFTRGLFEGQVEVVECCDPEIPGDAYFVFRVTTHGTLDELSAKHDQWHRMLLDIASVIRTAFRLSIDAHSSARR